MVAGAFNDNAVIESKGVAGDQLPEAQLRLLRKLIAAYVGWGADPHAEVDTHLDETHFCWMGSGADHARVELVIRDLKQGAGLEHIPSGSFPANGACSRVPCSPTTSPTGPPHDPASTRPTTQKSNGGLRL